MSFRARFERETRNKIRFTQKNVVSRKEKAENNIIEWLKKGGKRANQKVTRSKATVCCRLQANKQFPNLQK